MGYDIETVITHCRQAARRGTDWLLGLMRPDGAIGPAEERLFYYRVPWAFALMGEMTAASRNLDWIRRHMFTAEGAFEGISPQGGFEERYGSYPLACLLVGASMLQRFDIVYPGTRRLLQWQDPNSGGLWHVWTERTPQGEQEIFPTAQGGMTFLLTGQIEAARQAGQWFKRLRELQPDWEHKLYAVWTPAGGLVTQVPAGQVEMYITRKDAPWQHHFNGGIAAAFLAELFLATGEQEWLDLARDYQAFSMTSDECMFQSMQTCKSGWGAGLLWIATREPAYREWAARMGEWFCAHQFPDGHWENTKYWTPHPTTSINVEVTAEFVMHLANLIAYLSVG